jgi:hypothetical protein
MAPTPPPSPPPSAAFLAFQLHHQAVRQRERLQRDRLSPELRRVPSASTLLSTVFPPPPPRPVSAPVPFNGQSFNHLPPDIVAGLRNLEPFPTVRTRRNAVQSNVSFTF